MSRPTAAGAGDRSGTLRARLRPLAFLFGLVGVVSLAWILPDPGAQGGSLRSETTRQLAIVVIFVVQGLALPTERFLSSLRLFGLYGFVLGWGYVLFPAVVWGMLWLSFGGMSPEIVTGFVYLSLLPTTISASVFFTARAEGNAAGAVFNAFWSNILAVFLTPLGMLLLATAQTDYRAPLAQTFWDLIWLIVFPIIFGQLLRPLVNLIFPKIRGWFGKITTFCIFFIMYCTFCDGVKNVAWDRLGWQVFVLTPVFAAGALGLVTVFVWKTSAWFGFSRSIRIAALFSASHKSLAVGVPMANLIIPIQPGSEVSDLSVVLIPLICYHLMQLSLGSVLAERLRGNPIASRPD